ncbi:glycosyltransferase family 2 protein [Azohydromonas lata]|uniref:Glycosyltransferase family 2 protein n=1 Tax=Azohydromonas lata TaxID=45677 RepID=A0ABU5ICZ5_9BURK|nr:glycosyltransferase family 2 protein [Azohydromonas lata]MDZ5456525.1 glycosyltransferase family 2 protein [Azohydromonas lata]
MKAVAVVVAYHLEPPALRPLLDSVAEAGLQAVVVDNTPGRAVAPPGAGPEWLVLGRNSGIAHAQNVGVARARALGAQAVLLLDQDSRLGADMVRRLLAGLRPGVPAIVAPVSRDARLGVEYPSFRFSALGYPRRVYAAHAAAPVPVDLVIASGSAATMAVFDLAGGMDEDFFIDYVDFEWCIRCRARGVDIHVLPGVEMEHAIGAAAVQAGPLTVFVHGPARCYYRLRNAFLLWRKPLVPRLFAFKTLAASLMHHLLQLRAVADRRQHLAAGWAALCHGLSGVRGERP